jgi:hypothetical protein
MQFKVPQNVQQADRIVWFLTLPQLIICVVGFAMAYAIYTVLDGQGLPLLIWIFPVGVVALLTAAFAFLKIANLPFYRYLALLIERLITPSKRVWVKGADRVITDEKFQSLTDKKASIKKKKEEEFLAAKEEGIQNIGKLTEDLDNIKKEAQKDENIEKIDETADEGLIKTAFLDEKHPQKNVKKKEMTAEDKILELSKKPGRKELEEEKAKEPQDNQDSQEEKEKPKKKRRRRRRRKKKINTEELGQHKELEEKKTEEKKQARSETPRPEKKTPKSEKAIPTESKVSIPRPEQSKTPPPVPDWLNEAPKTAPESEVSIPRPQKTAPKKATPESEVSIPRPQKAAPSPVRADTAPRPKEKKQDPPLPEWMNEAHKEEPSPKVQARGTEEKGPKEKVQGTTESEDSIPRPTESKTAIPQPEEKKQDSTLLAGTSGEFTPDQLEGEGQVIRFDSSESNNDQKTNPNKQ